MYTSLVRPYFEYVVQDWSSTREMDIRSIENVQARATKIPTSMINLGYEARLKRWDINRLEDKRVKSDFIQMFKSVNGLHEIKWENHPVNLSSKRILTRSLSCMIA